MGRIAAVDRAHRPLVVVRLRRDITTSEHRLDRQDHARLEASLNTANVVVEDVRRHVHLRADTVANELFDDAGFPAVDKSILRNDGFDRVADRTNTPPRSTYAPQSKDTMSPGASS